MLSAFPSTGNPVKRFPPEDKKIPTRVQFPTEPKTEQWQEFLSWQRVKDSNPHIQSQSLLCYPYTNPLSYAAFANASIIIPNMEGLSRGSFQKMLLESIFLLHILQLGKAYAIPPGAFLRDFNCTSKHRCRTYRELSLWETPPHTSGCPWRRTAHPGCGQPSSGSRCT